MWQVCAFAERRMLDNKSCWLGERREHKQGREHSGARWCTPAGGVWVDRHLELLRGRFFTPCSHLCVLCSPLRCSVRWREGHADAAATNPQLRLCMHRAQSKPSRLHGGDGSPLLWRLGVIASR
jgi:hypothetical protein